MLHLLLLFGLQELKKYFNCWAIATTLNLVLSVNLSLLKN